MTFVGYGGISVRRQGVQGLHVHVGMPSAEECWRCLEAILPWLPVVLALSANSPWFAGELTGMASNRAPVLAELPRAAAPPAFASYAEWESWVGRLVSLGVDRGLHAHLVGRATASEARHARGADPRPADRRRLSAAFAALLQAMCATALDGGLPPRRGAARRRRPCRLRAEPLGGGALRPARRAAASARHVVRPRARARAELVELVLPAARTLGGEDALARLDPNALRGRPAAAERDAPPKRPRTSRRGR